MKSLWPREMPCVESVCGVANELPPNAAYFIKGLLPGVNPLAPEGSPEVGSVADPAPNLPMTERPLLGCLVEIEDSSFAERCKKAYAYASSRTAPNFRHYCIMFLSENVVFHIVAEDVDLSEAVRVAVAG